MGVTREIIGSAIVRLLQTFQVSAGVDSSLNPQLLRVDSKGALITSLGFSIPENDYSIATYYDAGNTNLHTVVFRLGGANGTVVATITITYFGDPVATANAKFQSRAITYP